MKCSFVIALFSGLLWLHALQGASPGGYVIEWGWDPAYATVREPKLVCSNAIAISASLFHKLALCSDGTVYAWGGDAGGAVSGSPQAKPVETNGRVKLNGRTLDNVIAISAARDFSLALRSDGTVVTWRDNWVPDGLSNIVSIATAGALNFAVRRDGTVAEWERGYLSNVPGLTNVAAIAIGESCQGTRNLALRRDGTIVTWKSGIMGNRAIASPIEIVPAGLSNVIQVAAGAAHSLALKRDGTVFGWGWNQSGEATGMPTTNSPDGLNFIASGQVQIGGQVLTDVSEIAAAHGYSMALRKDGTVIAWGRMVNNLYPVTVPSGLSNVVAIAAGSSSCLAITTNSAVAERFRH